MTIEQNAQVSNWGADGAEALPKAPPLPIDGVELKHCPWHHCTNAQFNFKRLPICPPHGHSPVSWGNLSLWWDTFTSVENQCLLLKRPSPSFRRPLWADNSLLGVLHHLLHRHNARSCCEYLQQNCKHSFKLYQKIRHQIRMNATHHPFIRCGLTPWGLFAMITRSSGMLVGEVLTVESVLLTIAVRIVLIRVALQARGRGGLCQEQQQGGAGRAVY